MSVIRNSLTIALALAVCAATLAARAQPAPKTVRLGVFAGGGSGFQGGYEHFRARLRELGYTEGRNLVFEVRNAEGKAERYPVLAAELARLKLDVIVVQGNAPLAALKQATQSVPIVMAVIGDPVGAGFVASLARPGGNITGLSNMAEGVSAKWVELLKQVAPGTTRIAVLRDPKNAAHSSMWKEIQDASQTLGVTPVAWNVRGTDDITRAFSAFGTEKIAGLVVLPQPAAGANLRYIVDLATRQGLPAAYFTREFALAGGLISYGPSIADLWRRAAEYVDRLLKGAKAADLPVGQPTKFELVVNRKAAAALGLTLPQSLLLRADEIIQ